MPYEREREIAVDAVTTACRLCERVQQELVTADTLAKSDQSPVTVADFGSQSIVAEHLIRYFSQDALVGEEESSALRDTANTALRENVIRHVQALQPQRDGRDILAAIDRGAGTCNFSQRYWTLDPVDGTKGFLRHDQYCVALALIENGAPALGVLGCPNLPFDLDHPEQGKGCLFVAVKGQGAWMRPLAGGDEQRVSVNAQTQPERIRFCESLESGHSSQDAHAAVAQRLGVTAAPIRMDSQCKYGLVARGEAAVYLRIMPYKAWIWDHAAGAILVQEAGGTVTDLRGQSFDFSQGRRLSRNSGVLATNGPLHQAALEAMAAAGGTAE